MNGCSRRALLAGLSGVAIVPASAAATHASDVWSLPRADHRNTGHAPVDGPAGSLDVDWARTFDSRIFTTPIPFEHSCYLATKNGRVVALELESGDEQWTTQLDETPFLALSPTTRQMLVPTNAGVVYSLDRATGDERWRQQIDDSIYSPVMTDENLVVFGTRDGTVYALDVADGETNWTATLPEGVRTTPALLEETVIARDENGTVVALDQATGDQLWRQPFEIGSYGGPVVRDDRVYVGGSIAHRSGAAMGRVVALDRTDGTSIWQREFDGPVPFHMVAGPDRLALFDGYRVYALDPTDGSTIWTVEEGGRAFLAGATDVLYVRGEDDVTVYDLDDGSERDSFDPDERLVSYVTDFGGDTMFSGGPIPIPGGVLMTSTDGTVWAIRGGNTLPSILGIAGGAGLLGLGAYALYRRRR